MSEEVLAGEASACISSIRSPGSRKGVVQWEYSRIK
jgi:hypothetical protein